ncbi:MAG: VOC family protein [Nitrospinota bacterium]
MLENLHHASITVSDIDACLSLYRDVLGMEVAMDMEFQGENVEQIMGRKGVRFRVLHLRHKDAVLEFLQFFEPEKTSGKTAVRHPIDVGITHIAFTVKDIQALTKALEEKGYEFLNPPIQTPSGRKVNYFRAHDGVIIELMQDPPK